MNARNRIPNPTIKRLSLYLRELELWQEQARSTISSRQLAEKLGLTGAQVRKDLAYFGQMGHPGVGYRVHQLHERLKQIIGTDRSWNAAIVGAGNIGRALMSYGRFPREGFDIVAVFDSNEKVVGQQIEGHSVRPLNDLGQLVRERNIQIGIISTPPSAAQEVADMLVDAGIKGILNFAPRRLDVGKKVFVNSVDFTVSLEQLAFQISIKQKDENERDRDS